MEWIAKIVEILKIPIKILLPAVCLFSGLLMLLPQNALEALSLYEWRKENGFLFGLLFLISLCMIMIYCVYYIKEKIDSFIFKKTLNRKTLKRIMELDDTRLAVIVALYNSPGYTRVFNYGEPIIQALLAENYLYAGGNQMVSLNIFTNEMPTKFILQPFVYRTLDFYKPKIKKEIEKLEQRIETEKKQTKIRKLQWELSNASEWYEAVYNGGFKNG